MNYILSKNINLYKNIYMKEGYKEINNLQIKLSPNDFLIVDISSQELHIQTINDLYDIIETNHFIDIALNIENINYSKQFEDILVDASKNKRLMLLNYAKKHKNIFISGNEEDFIDNINAIERSKNIGKIFGLLSLHNLGIHNER